MSDTAAPLVALAEAAPADAGTAGVARMGRGGLAVSIALHAALCAGLIGWVPSPGLGLDPALDVVEIALVDPESPSVASEALAGDNEPTPAVQAPEEAVAPMPMGLPPVETPPAASEVAAEPVPVEPAPAPVVEVPAEPTPVVEMPPEPAPVVETPAEPAPVVETVPEAAPVVAEAVEPAPPAEPVLRSDVVAETETAVAPPPAAPAVEPPAETVVAAAPPLPAPPVIKPVAPNKTPPARKAKPAAAPAPARPARIEAKPAATAASAAATPAVSAKSREALSRYLSSVRARIRRQGLATVGLERGQVEVSFRIAADGGFSGVRVARSTSDALEDAALRAVKRVSPADPIPPETGETSLSMSVTIEFR